MTDPDDPPFLHGLQMAPARFQEIKKEQKLFCDLADFPNSGSALLSKITTSRDYQSRIDAHESGVPTLMLQRVTDTSLLVHTRQPLAAATDARLKAPLARQANIFIARVSLCPVKVAQIEKTLGGLRGRRLFQASPVSTSSGNLGVIPALPGAHAPL